VIVTTPQDIALLDAKKALKMFEKVECAGARHRREHGHPRLLELRPRRTHLRQRRRRAHGAQYGVPLLGALPLDIHIREQADGGTPTVVAMPDSEAANRYRDIARKTAARLSLQARNKKIAFPNIVIQNT
jgi:ATP-binding protein involved in chromosome partitioning